MCNERNSLSLPVGWGGCRILRVHLCRGVRHPTNECPGYDPKQSDAGVPVMLEFWEMRSTLSMPSLPGPISPRQVTRDRVLSMGQMKLNCLLMLEIGLF